jgi:hypothetical protein
LIASSTVLITDGSPEARTRTSAGRFIKEGLSAAQRGTEIHPSIQAAEWSSVPGAKYLSLTSAGAAMKPVRARCR